MIGRLLSHYEIVAELGRGGMGIVYRARDRNLERDVALKVLPPGERGDPERQRRFLREARTAASLSHPAITTVYEVDEAEDLTFIAMELLSGESLAQHLTRGPLPVERALRLGVEIAAGLTAGHALGIVHRDLKPSNVMLTESEQAKIIDFGLAKPTADALFAPGSDASRTRTMARDTGVGQILGTAAYMSPEQARGAALDVRSDIFSFGALFFEMLMGRPAFRRDSVIETLHAILHDQAPVLSGLHPKGLEAALARIVERCLRKDPAARYANGAALEDDLRACARANAAEQSSADEAPDLACASGARLRVLIVDDEDPARALLREFLEGREDVEIVGECRNGFEAVKAVAELRPDLVLLDIQMPKLDGFEVLELIGPDVNVNVVFVTAFDQHALKAFEVHAVDYLLKPVSQERLELALTRARARLAARDPLPVASLVNAARTARIERMVVRVGANVQVIPLAELDFIEAQDDYVGLRYRGKTYLKQQTLNEAEAALDPQRFVRIHRSYLLNIERMARLESEAKDQRVAVMREGARLPISRSGYARLKKLL